MIVVAMPVSMVGATPIANTMLPMMLTTTMAIMITTGTTSPYGLDQGLSSIS